MAKASGKTATGKRGTRNEARRDTNKHDSIELRWKSADKYRASQTFHRWPGEYSRYLDHLTTIDMSFVETGKQRSRYENSHVLGVNDGPQPGSTGGRNDFPQQLTNLELFNVNKDESFPVSLIDSESGTAIFKDKCDEIFNGKVGPGMSTGRMHPPHLQQIGGS